MFLAGIAAFGLLDPLLRPAHSFGRRFEPLLGALRARRFVIPFGLLVGLVWLLGRVTTPLPFGRLAPLRRFRRAPFLSLSGSGLFLPCGLAFPRLRLALPPRLPPLGFSGPVPRFACGLLAGWLAFLGGLLPVFRCARLTSLGRVRVLAVLGFLPFFDRLSAGVADLHPLGEAAELAGEIGRLPGEGILPVEELRLARPRLGRSLDVPLLGDQF